MRNWMVSIAIACLTGFPVSAVAADQPDLLVPVDAGLAQKIRDYNGNEFERLSFFTRRWRIVEVRPEVLCQSEVVRFGAFPDAEFIVRISPRTNPAGAPWPGSWQGTIESPMLPEEERDRREQALAWILDNVPQMQFEGADDTMRAAILGKGGQFFLGYWAVDATTGIAEEIQPPPASDPCAAFRDTRPNQGLQPDAVSDQVSDSAGFFAVSARVWWPAIGDERLTQPTQYHLEPLKCSPRYHLVYEHDHFRRWAIGGSGPEAEVVQQQWHEFLATLPADEACVLVADIE